MNYETLIVEIMNGIGIVWMNRPKVRNALNGTMIAELTSVMDVLEEDPAVHAVVLAGVGGHFCSGGDIEWMQRLAAENREMSLADTRKLAALLYRVDTLIKPTVARVQGLATGGGTGLIAACDIAVGSHEAEFCFTEVRIGLFPSTIAPYVIRAMGERMARRYFLSAERFPAAEAFRIGLLSDIVPLAELDQKINELLGHLILGGPCAQAISKAWIRRVADAPLTADLIEESAVRTADARASEEGQEGMLAFLGKRKPAWQVQARKAASAKKPAPAPAPRKAPKPKARIGAVKGKKG